MKICSKCKIEKDESEFKNKKGYKDYIYSICKKCESYYSKIYREKNKEKAKKYAEEYYQNNKDFIKNKIKKYKENHKDYYSNYGKIYYKQNKEKIQNYKKEYDLKNKEKIKSHRYTPEYRKERRKQNIEIERKKGREYVFKRKLNEPEYKLKSIISHLFYYSIKIKKLTKNKELFKYTGISYSDYINHFENNYPIEFNRMTEKGKYHIDHIIPVSVYDFTDEEEIKKCWNPHNLRIITEKENLDKKDKLDFDLIKKHKIEYLLPKNLRRC
jgi:hypothetical protein